MRSEREVVCAIETYADMVQRLCMTHVKSEADADDIFQCVFLKYALHAGKFQSKEHEKAWLIRVTVNACHDLLRGRSRRQTVSLEEAVACPAPQEEGAGRVLEAVRSLPEHYRDVVYLHYYEGYTAREIGEILHRNVNTVYTLLTRSKKILREKLEGDAQ